MAYIKVPMRYPVLLFIICLSCGKQLDQKKPQTVLSGFIAYTIPKCGHYALQSEFRSFQGKALTYTVKFDSSAIYRTADPHNQEDVNKLFGFSDNNNHHETSARFGWNWDGNSIRLYAYCYELGNRSITPLGKVDINKEYDCSIKLIPGSYEFSLSDYRVNIPRQSDLEEISGYHLYPYFGGDETAPHDITVYLRAD